VSALPCVTWCRIGEKGHQGACSPTSEPREPTLEELRVAAWCALPRDPDGKRMVRVDSPLWGSAWVEVDDLGVDELREALGVQR